LVLPLLLWSCSAVQVNQYRKLETPLYHWFMVLALLLWSCSAKQVNKLRITRDTTQPLVYGSAFTSLELFCSTDKSVQKT
jgi:hypothetical protein